MKHSIGIPDWVWEAFQQRYHKVNPATEIRDVLTKWTAENITNARALATAPQAPAMPLPTMSNGTEPEGRLEDLLVPGDSEEETVARFRPVAKTIVPRLVLEHGMPSVEQQNAWLSEYAAEICDDLQINHIENRSTLFGIVRSHLDRIRKQGLQG